MRPARPALILVASLLAAGCLSGGPLTGQPAPAFETVLSDGTRFNETTFLGRFVILDLMATWCGPCKLEVAHLRDVQALHGDAVVIVSIGVDPQETIQDLERFGDEYGASWPYAIDRDGKIKAAMEMRIIPKLVIVDPQGLVVFEREGEVLPAAITRVIDPASAPPAGAVWLASLAALVLGVLAPFNPYRRLHREATTAGPTLAALGILAALAMLAWPFSGFASTRATYGSLFIGGLTLLALGWWFRARKKASAEPRPGNAVQVASDRAYEMAPHFVGALVLALGGIGSVGFFGPLAAFLVGAVAGLLARPGVGAREREILGLVGLALVGVGLGIFGARIFGI